MARRQAKTHHGKAPGHGILFDPSAEAAVPSGRGQRSANQSSSPNSPAHGIARPTDVTRREPAQKAAQRHSGCVAPVPIWKKIVTDKKRSELSLLSEHLPDPTRCQGSQRMASDAIFPSPSLSPLRNTHPRHLCADCVAILTDPYFSLTPSRMTAFAVTVLAIWLSESTDSVTLSGSLRKAAFSRDPVIWYPK